MTIGENIKYWRQKCNMTQQELADALCVSFQAVSKWERNECFPDVTLISKLSKMFQVSCDTLLLGKDYFTEQEIDSIIEEADILAFETRDEYLRKIEILENALDKSPYSIRLMATLADAYSRGTQYHEYQERDYLSRTIELEEYIAENTKDMRQKYQAITMLCYMYRGTEKYERIRELAESMPELDQTRSALIYHSMPGAEQLDGIYQHFVNLLDAAECYLNLLIYPNEREEEKKHFDTIRCVASNRVLWCAGRYQ